MENLNEVVKVETGKEKINGNGQGEKPKPTVSESSETVKVPINS